MRRSFGFALSSLLVWSLLAPSAYAVAASGEVEIVNGTGSSSRISSGGSATVFSLKLPKNSMCPGDSADDNYRVQSFLIPAGTDPGEIRYKSQGPDVAGGWAVYKTTTNAYIQELTADAPKKGDPGPIIDLPDLSFAVFTGGELHPGSYQIGVACSLWNDTVKYWSTDIVLSKDDKDRPARLRWRLASAEGGSSSSKAPIAAGAAAAVVVAVVAVRRRRTAS